MTDEQRDLAANDSSRHEDDLRLLDRQMAEALGWKWGDCPAFKGTVKYTTGQFVKYDNRCDSHGKAHCWEDKQGNHHRKANFSTDPRQFMPLLEMGRISVGPNRRFYKVAWTDGWDAAASGRSWEFHPQIGIAICRAFLVWLEPMTPEQRAQALGRTG